MTRREGRVEVSRPHVSPLNDTVESRTKKDRN